MHKEGEAYEVKGHKEIREEEESKALQIIESTHVSLYKQQENAEEEVNPHYRKGHDFTEKEKSTTTRLIQTENFSVHFAPNGEIYSDPYEEENHLVLKQMVEALRVIHKHVSALHYKA